MLRDLGIDPPEINGGTKVFVLVGGSLAGAIILGDEVRPESREGIRELKEMGTEVYMLTGDDDEAAELVSRELGNR